MACVYTDTKSLQYSDVAEARKAERKAKGKRDNGLDGTTAADVETDEDEDDPEADERDWPFQVARIGDNSSLAYWEFTE
jgi:hypothetical protein